MQKWHSRVRLISSIAFPSLAPTTQAICKSELYCCAVCFLIHPTWKIKGNLG